MKDLLIVDGYNIIGAWPELRALKNVRLEDARDRLIEILANYQGFSGLKIIVVFDAHQVPGLGAKFREFGLDLIYTKEKETADECIERLVTELHRPKRTIHVATSDLVEQHVAFGQGALRKPARELLLDIEESRKNIGRTLSEPSPGKRINSVDGKMNDAQRRLFEKWRRGK